MKRIVFLLALLLIALSGEACIVNIGSQVFDCKYVDGVTCSGAGCVVNPNPIPLCDRIR
jgi:hypothetical protein